MAPFFSLVRSLPLLIAVTLSLLIALTASLHAQGGRSSDNILYPQTDLPFYIGPEFGWGMWTNTASFNVGDSRLPCAHFTDGDGNGPTAGARAFLYLNQWLIFAPRLRYEARSGAFVTMLPDEPILDEANRPAVLTQEAQVDVTMAAATLDVMFGVDIASTGVYVVGGIGTSLLTSGFYDYTERLKSPADMVYDDTGTNEHTLVTRQSFETYKSLAFDLRGGAGYLLKLGRWAINPEVFYSLPLTSALDAPDELKQTGIVGSLGILYHLNGGE